MRAEVDVALFAAAVYDVPGQAAWRARVGGRYLLALEEISPANGTFVLLEAHATLVQEHPALADVRLVVTGSAAPRDDACQEEFRRRASELGTEPVVLTAMCDADRPALVAGASAAAYLPTDDVVRRSALEALAAGVPVVARDLPAVRACFGEAVLYGDTMLCIADALVDVLTVPPEPGVGVELAAAYGAHATAEGPLRPPAALRRPRSGAAARSARSWPAGSRGGPSARRGPG